MPGPKRPVLAPALLSGTLASIASTAMLVIMGHRELGDAAAPLNGPSQWVWGRDAKYCNGFSVRHTLVGYAIHHLASVGWAALFERCRGKGCAGPAVAVSAVAGMVDFRLTPRRLRPGFEKRISRRAVVLVYCTFALGLAASAVFRTADRPPRPSREPSR